MAAAGGLSLHRHFAFDDCKLHGTQLFRRIRRHSNNSTARITVKQGNIEDFGANSDYELYFMQVKWNKVDILVD